MQTNENGRSKQRDRHVQRLRAVEVGGVEQKGSRSQVREEPTLSGRAPGCCEQMREFTVPAGPPCSGGHVRGRRPDSWGVGGGLPCKTQALAQWALTAV